MEAWRTFDDEDEQSWHALTTRSARGRGGFDWEPRSTLQSQIEHHLLLAMLTPEQRRSVQTRGWFEVPWPEQVLVLRVHVERVPTVDAFQAYRAGANGRPLEGRAAAKKGPLLAGVYLCSWDVRDACVARTHGFPATSQRYSPVTLAKRLVVARRRGVLREFLEQSQSVSLGQLVGRTGETLGR